MSRLATFPLPRNNAHVPPSCGTGFGDLDQIGGLPPLAAFFASVHRYSHAQFRAGRSGEPDEGCRFRFAGSPTPLRACSLRLATESRFQTQIGAPSMHNTNHTHSVPGTRDATGKTVHAHLAITLYTDGSMRYHSHGSTADMLAAFKREIERMDAGTPTATPS